MLGYEQPFALIHLPPKSNCLKQWWVIHQRLLPSAAEGLDETIDVLPAISQRRLPVVVAPEARLGEKERQGVDELLKYGAELFALVPWLWPP